jgi:hypothetical protein
MDGVFSHGVVKKQKDGKRKSSKAGIEESSKRRKCKVLGEGMNYQRVVLEETHADASILQSNMTVEAMTKARIELTAEINRIIASSK